MVWREPGGVGRRRGGTHIFRSGHPAALITLLLLHIRHIPNHVLYLYCTQLCWVQPASAARNLDHTTRCAKPATRNPWVAGGQPRIPQPATRNPASGLLLGCQPTGAIYTAFALLLKIMGKAASASGTHDSTVCGTGRASPPRFYTHTTRGGHLCGPVRPAHGALER